MSASDQVSESNNIAQQSFFQNEEDFNWSDIKADLIIYIAIAIITRCVVQCLTSDPHTIGYWDGMSTAPLGLTLGKIFRKKVWPHVKYEDIVAVAIFSIGCASEFFLIGLAIAAPIEIYRIVKYNT